MSDLLQKGIAAFRAGNREEARKYILLALQQNRDDEKTWEWAYNISHDDKERGQCLRQILRINPQNSKAKELLEQLEFVSPSSDAISTQLDKYLERWGKILPRLNDPLEAWGKRDVDTSDPHWMEKLAKVLTPIDTDKKLREQFLMVTKEIIDVYFKSNYEQCASIRIFLNNYKGVQDFLGAKSLSAEFDNDTELFIFRLVSFSMREWYDPRDEITSLDWFCEAAEQAGVEIRPYLEKVARLSSDENRYGMGSKRDMILAKSKKAG
jgi:tetratricopeptide (TPR) repeat protein